MPKLGKIRIIGGQWRGRKLHVLDKSGLRPTTDRVRETLFNWLQFSIAQSECLDLFAGSGILGIEAASRGAKKVISVEKDVHIAQHLTKQVTLLDKTPFQILNIDAYQFLKQPPQHQFDIVFLDPPFGKNLLQPCCQLLEENNFLKPDAYIYLEAEKNLNTLELPKNWQIIKQKVAGQVTYALAQCY